MHTPDSSPWDRDDLFETIAREIDAAYLEGQPFGVVKVSVCDVDIPATVSEGIIYIQIPFPFLLKAVAAGIPDSLRHLEARISVTGRGSFPSARYGRPVFSKRVALEGVVRDGKVER